MVELPPSCNSRTASPSGHGGEAAGADGPPSRVAPAAPAESPGRYVRVAAMEAVMAERHRHIFACGHTPEKDRGRSLAHFARQLARQGIAVTEYTQFNRPALVRAHAVTLAALCLALIDRIDADTPEGK
jgi:hypothetical protein